MVLELADLESSRGFQIDYRIGGRVTGVLGGEKLTLFPDVIRKCVAYACIHNLGGSIPIGTVFCVGMPTSYGTGAFLYFVTARHVVLGAREHSPDGCLHIRVNLRIGETFEIKTQLKDWIFHPTNETVDVAVLPLGLPPKVRDRFDMRGLDIDMFATDAIISKEGIGIGDSVFLTGLFTAHTGKKRNIPIVRLGSIAEAYLVEARSIGGLSGSPVFVYLGLVREGPDGRLSAWTDDLGMRTTSGTFYLLGLMHGHWDSGSSDVDMMKDSRGESINLGIAVVIPATKILEVLNQPKLQEFRQSLEAGSGKGQLKPDNLQGLM